MKIEKCKKNDESLLITYINEYWKENHVLVRNNDLMKWQHLDNDFYNFYIFKNNDSICGIIGFIPTSKFDSKLINNKDYFGAIWSVNKDAPPATGHFLIKKLISLESPKFIGFVGISNQAKVFYSRWGLEINHLKQYFIINKTLKNFKIIKGCNNINVNNVKSKYKLIKIERLNKIKLKHRYKPFKTINYLINRYQNHPVYNYLFYGIQNEKNELKCIFIIRKEFFLKSSCLRIVDIYGNIDDIKSVKSLFEDLLLVEGAEYIDLLNFGIKSEVFKRLGFTMLNLESKKDIVPNYFQPFIRKNIKIEFCVISEYNDYVIFRGDGDQDRPN